MSRNLRPRFQQPSSSPPPPPPAKRMKKVYEVGAIESRNKWYLDEETADVHFVIDSTDTSSVRIPAHKILLARDSDVFKAMFYGAMKEKHDICLTDVSEGAFKEFLQFFYLTEVELSVEHLADVMHLGHKYNAGNCVDVCVRFFKDVHNAENILIGLDAGILYEHSELVGFCERFIVLNTDAVLKSNGFLKCNRKLLAHILNANLFICSEVELFEACMAWVKSKSGHDVLTKAIVDKHVGELFYDTRFGSMSMTEFCNLSEKYDAVLSDDYKTITKLIMLPRIQQDRFNTRPRQIKWNDANGDAGIMKCNRQSSSCKRWTNATGTKTLKFYTNQPLLLNGFTCCKTTQDNNVGSSDESSSDDDEDHDASSDSHTNNDFTIELEIIEASDSEFSKRSSKILTKSSATLQLNVDDNVVQLPRPVLIKPDFFYQISINHENKFHFYHTYDISESVKLGSGAVIDFRDPDRHNYHYYGGNSWHCNNTHSNGLISSLEFSRI